MLRVVLIASFNAVLFISLILVVIYISVAGIQPTCHVFSLDDNRLRLPHKEALLTGSACGMCCTGVVVFLTVTLAMVKHCRHGNGFHVANLKPTFFLLVSFIAGMLGNVALLTVVRQAYGKPSPSFLSVCLQPPDDPPYVDVDTEDTHARNSSEFEVKQDLHDPGLQDLRMNNSSVVDGGKTRTLPRNHSLAVDSKDYEYLSDRGNVVSVDICLNKMAVQHCNSFYCPHSTVLFYTAPFVFAVLDILLSKNELTSAVCKCVCLCVCAFVSFDTVSRNMHDVFDVVAGAVVGIGSGRWFLKNIYSRFMVRNIAILSFSDQTKQGSQEFEIDYTRSEEFSVF